MSTPFRVTKGQVIEAGEGNTFTAKRDGWAIWDGDTPRMLNGKETTRMTAPAFEEVPMPEPFATLHDDGYWTMPPGKVPHAANYAGWREHVYTADQLRAYGDQRANAALEEAKKLRKLIADHNDECVRMCDSRFANGPTQCPMRAYNRQCPDCPKDGMVEVPALKKENGDA